MKKKINKKVIRPTNALNAFLFLVILSVIVGIVILVLNSEYGFDGEEKSPLKKYKVEMEIINISENDIDEFSVGSQFYISNENMILGNIIDVSTADNKTIISFEVVGNYSKDNEFMLNGNIYLSLGKQLKIKCDKNNYIVNITDISSLS